MSIWLTPLLFIYLYYSGYPWYFAIKSCPGFVDTSNIETLSSEIKTITWWTVGEYWFIFLLLEWNIHILPFFWFMPRYSWYAAKVGVKQPINQPFYFYFSVDLYGKFTFFFFFPDDLYGKFTFSSSVYEVLESKGVLEIDVLFHRKLPV